MYGAPQTWGVKWRCCISWWLPLSVNFNDMDMRNLFRGLAAWCTRMFGESCSSAVLGSVGGHRCSRKFSSHIKSTRHKDYMQQVPYCGPTNIKRHQTQFSRPFDLASGVCPSAVLVIFLFYLFSRLYDVSTYSCAHLTIILFSSSICLCHSSLLPLIPFPPSVL